jgi:hypothetical protein
MCRATEACPIVVACRPGHPSPCDSIRSIHQHKLALCDRLEAVADSLPWRIDRLECLKLAGELAPSLRRDHAFEETHVFPAFETNARGPDGARSVARLKEEHVADECAAVDLSEVLLRIGHGGEVDNPEALGFMLRALFQALRRHVAFEREHILPGTAGGPRQ